MRGFLPLLGTCLVLALPACGRSGSPEDIGEDGRVVPIPRPSVGASTPTPTPAFTAPQCEVPTEPGLVGCWDCDVDCNDRSVHAHTFAALANITGVPGALGDAVELDATSEFVVATDPVFNVGDFTLEAWVWVPALGSLQTLLYHDPQFWLRITAAGALECIVDNDISGESANTADGAIPIAAWTHVACAVDENNFHRVYINGSNATVFDSGGSSSPSASTSDLFMGKRSNGAEDLVGRLDAIRIWNVLRSDADICAASGNETCP